MVTTHLMENDGGCTVFDLCDWAVKSSMGKSNDYHDYVFRDGRLVGEFEEMYRNSSTLPWHQDEQANWMDVRLTKELIRDIGYLSEIHDLGCGTGHYLNLIAQEFSVPESRRYGYDIAETACKKAAEGFPGCTFSVLDLTAELGENNHSLIGAVEPPSDRLFMIRGTLWYVFPKLTTVIGNIRGMMTSRDKLLVVQNFPPLESQFVGKDVIPNYFALVNHFSQCFVLDRHIWYEDRFGAANDNWFIGIFSLKG
jgi:hypothetical protein